MSIWIVSVILMLTLYLLMSEKIPVDLTAVGIMVALVLTRILTPLEAVAGFASPAVITVGAISFIYRDFNDFRFSDFHSYGSLFKAWNHLALTQGKLKKFTSNGCIEYSTIVQCACVLDLNGVTNFRRRCY